MYSESMDNSAITYKQVLKVLFVCYTLLLWLKLSHCHVGLIICSYVVMKAKLQIFILKNEIHKVWSYFYVWDDPQKAHRNARVSLKPFS
jgi:hypothetical protein